MPVKILLTLAILLLFSPEAKAGEIGLFGQPLPLPTSGQATPTQVVPNPTTPPVDGGGSGSGSGGGGDSSGGGGGGGDSGGGSSGGSGGGVAADLNSSGRVDIFDLSILLSNWNKAGKGDVNSSGVVDIFDLSILLSNWTK